MLFANVIGGAGWIAERKYAFSPACHVPLTYVIVEGAKVRHDSHMPLYFFHSREGGAFVPDEQGRTFDNIEAATTNAVTEARALMAYQVRDGTLNLDGEIQITAVGGVRLATISFEQALEVVR